MSNDPHVSITFASLLRFFLLFTLKKDIPCHHAGGCPFGLTIVNQPFTQEQARD